MSPSRRKSNANKNPFQPVSKIFISRTYYKQNIRKHESMPEIKKATKPLKTENLRSISLNDVLMRTYSSKNCLTDVLDTTCTKRMPSFPFKDLANCENNILNKFTTTINEERCGFSSEWIFKRKYDSYFEPSCLVPSDYHTFLSLTEDGTVSEKSLLCGFLTEISQCKAQSIEEIEDNKNVSLNVIQSKNYVLYNSDDDNNSSNEYSVVSHESINSNKLNIPNNMLNTNDDAILLLLEGKTPKEKEKILNRFNILGIMLPEDKIFSERELLGEDSTDNEFAPRPYTAEISGVLNKKATYDLFLKPVQTKSTLKNENILLGLTYMSGALPEWRSASEKCLGAKAISGANVTESDNSQFECLCELLTPDSDNDSLRVCDLESAESDIAASQKSNTKTNILNILEMQYQSNDAGILTLLKGKTPKQQQNILKGLVMLGIPLPDGKILSDEKLIMKIRTDLGHIPQTLSSKILEIHEKYAEKLLQDSRSSKLKESMLSSDKGLFLPKDRSYSEISLGTKVTVQKVPFKLTTKLHKETENIDNTTYLSDKSLCDIETHESVKDVLAVSRNKTSEEISEAKRQGILLLLEGETPKQKVKILKGLAMLGIELPKVNTNSDKKLPGLIDTDLGQPPRIKTVDISKKRGICKRELLQPLTGKKIKDNCEQPEALSKAKKNFNKFSKISTEISDVVICKSNIVRTKSEEIVTRDTSEAKLAKTAMTAGNEIINTISITHCSKIPERNKNNLKGLFLHDVMLPEKCVIGDNYNKAADKRLQLSEDSLLMSEGLRLPKQHIMADRSFEGSINTNKTDDLPVIEIKPRCKSTCTPLLSESNLYLVPVSSEKMQQSKEEGLLLLLEGETPTKKEYVLKVLAMLGIPLPEGMTNSDKELIDRVRIDLGLPPNPKTTEMKKQYEKAAMRGLLQPLEGKSQEQKENILRGLANMCIPLPKGRSKSEKTLINKIATVRPIMTFDCSEQVHKRSTSESLLHSLQTSSSILKSIASKISLSIQKPKGDRLFISLANKSPGQKQKIFKELAIHGIMLPEGRTDSDKRLLDKVRKNLGLPPEPQTEEMRKKYEHAAEKGILLPLYDKTQSEKENILRGFIDLGIPLPKGRSSSERKLIQNMKCGYSTSSTYCSSKKNANKKITKITKPQESPVPVCKCISPGKISTSTGCCKICKAKAYGLLTPLDGKPIEKKQNILKGLAIHGIMLPEGKTESDKNLIEQVCNDLGLPPKPQTKQMKEKYEQAADKGLLHPLEGKTPKEKEKILKGLVECGIPLPKGRCSSEKALVTKLTAKKSKLCQGRKRFDKKFLKKLSERECPVAKCECAMKTKECMKQSTKKSKFKSSTSIPISTKGKSKCVRQTLLLDNKSSEEKQQILRDLATRGLNLPEGKNKSEKVIISQIRNDLGLPPEPQTPEMREKYEQAADKGLLQPLNGKTPKQKEKILKGLINFGIPLPKGRCASEKALIEKICRRSTDNLKVSRNSISNKFLNKIKCPSLPKVCCCSKQAIAKKISTTEKKYRPETSVSCIELTKGCCSSDFSGVECKCEYAQSEEIVQKKISLCDSETKISERLQTAKDTGLLTPIHAKTSEQKCKILKGLANLGIQLPEGTTEYDKTLIDQVRYNLGLPPEPRTAEMRYLYKKAEEKGLLKPLNGKSSREKVKIIKGLINLGIPLPKGRSASEIELINKLKETRRQACKINKKHVAPKMLLKMEDKIAEAKLRTPFENKLLKKIKAAGLPSPKDVCSLSDSFNKTKLLAKNKFKQFKKPGSKESFTCLGSKAYDSPPLVVKRSSDKQICTKVNHEVGSQECASQINYDKAQAIGIIVPLDGKTGAEKKLIMQRLHDAGILLAEGRTSSQQLLINDIKKGLSKRDSSIAIQDRKISKESIDVQCHLKVKPVATDKSSSDKKIFSKAKRRKEICRNPDLPALIKKNDKAQTAGIIIPLGDKTPAEKKIILQQLHNAGICLPEGRTCSEKRLLNEIKGTKPDRKIFKTSSGLQSPLKCKSLEKKDEIQKSSSENNFLDSARILTRLPPGPKRSSSETKRCCGAQTRGMLISLKGKTSAEKKKILRQLQDPEIPSSEERKCCEITKTKKGLVSRIGENIKKLKQKVSATSQTSSEGNKFVRGKKIKETSDSCSAAIKASAKQLFTKMKREKEPFLGIKTPSLIAIYDKPPAACVKTSSNKQKLTKKTKRSEQSEVCRAAKTPTSEDLMIKEFKKGLDEPDTNCSRNSSSRSLKRTGSLTPLKDNIKERKEKILRDLLNFGFSLPMSKTPSERKLLANVRRGIGLPPEPGSPLARHRYELAQAAGIILPLEGKTCTEKKKILQQLHNAAIPLPEARTPSEELMIKEIQKGFCFCFQSSTASAKNDCAESQKVTRLPNYMGGKTIAQTKKKFKDILIAASAKKLSNELITKIKHETVLPSRTETPFQSPNYDIPHPVDMTLPFESKSIINSTFLQQNPHTGIPLSEGQTPLEGFMVNEIRKECRQPQCTHGQTGFRTSAGSQAHSGCRNCAQKGKRYMEPCSPLPIVKQTSDYRSCNKQLVRQQTGQKISKQCALDDARTRKEKLLKDLLSHGFSLPISKTPSEKQLLDCIRRETGLPPEPVCPSIVEKPEKAIGIILPLEGMTMAEKRKILQQLHDAKMPLPKGKTSSEELLIKEITKGSDKSNSGAISPTKRNFLIQKRNLLHQLHDSGTALSKRISRTFSECKKKLVRPDKCEAGRPSKTLSSIIEKMKAQKKKILKDLLKLGFSLPLSKSPSEKQLLDEVRLETGLPPEPKCPSIKERYEKAQAAGIILPLEGKTPAEKKRILHQLCDAGIPLPKGRTLSEESMINRIKQKNVRSDINSTTNDQKRSVQWDRFSTPTNSEVLAQKEKILKELLEFGFSLPIAKTISEKQLLDKVRRDTGLPPESQPSLIISSNEQLQAPGIVLPLEGKASKVTKNILQRLHDANIPLPEGQTSSEKLMINEIKRKSIQVDTPWQQHRDVDPPELLYGKSDTESEKSFTKLNVANDKLSSYCCCHPSKTSMMNQSDKDSTQHLATHIEKQPTEASRILSHTGDKTPKQKENLLKGLLKAGLPLPVAKTSSQKVLIDKVRRESGLPPESKADFFKSIHKNACCCLKNRTLTHKNSLSRNLQNRPNIPHSDSPTLSTVNKNKNMSIPHYSSSKRPKATECTGIPILQDERAAIHKEQKLKRLVKAGLPLPMGKTQSEKKIIDKIRCQCGLPPIPNTPALRKRYKKAQAAGLITPLNSKPPAEKKKILQKWFDAGIPLPEGRTPSEDSMIKNIIKCACTDLSGSELKNKTISTSSQTYVNDYMTAQTESYPITNTPTDMNNNGKTRLENNLNPKPKTVSSMSQTADIGAYLESFSKKKSLHDEEIYLPKDRTCSENFKTGVETTKVSKSKPINNNSEKSLKEKELIMRKNALQGLPLPETKTRSDKKIANKIRKELGLPPEPQTPQMKLKYEEGIRAGILKPLEGLTAQEKENLLRKQLSMGIPLPNGRSPSEKSLIARIKREGHISKTSCRKPSKKKTLIQKTSVDKGRVAESLAEAGIYIPIEQRTTREIKNIQKNLARAGYILPESHNASEIDVVTAQEQKMLKDLLAAGIPLPKNLTPSEKALIKNLIRPENINFKHFRHALSARISHNLFGESRTQNDTRFVELMPTVNPLLVVKTPPDYFSTTTTEKYNTETKPLKDNTIQNNKEMFINCHRVTSSSEADFQANKIQTKNSQKSQTNLDAYYLKCRSSKEIETLEAFQKPDLSLLDRTTSHKNLTVTVDKKKGSRPEQYSSMCEGHYKHAIAEIYNSLELLSLEEKKSILPTQTVETKSKGSSVSKNSMVMEKAGLSKIPLKKLGQANYFIASKNKECYENKRVYRDISVSEVLLPVDYTPSNYFLISNVAADFNVPPTVNTTTEIDAVHNANDISLPSNFSEMKKVQNDRLRVFGEASTKGISVSVNNILNQTIDGLGPLTELTYLGNNVLSSGKSSSVNPIKTINIIECDNQLCNYDNTEYKLTQRCISKVKSYDIFPFIQFSKEFESEIQGKVIVKSDRIKLTVGNSVCIISDSLCDTDSLLFVLKTDVIDFKSLSDESDSHNPTECNSAISSGDSNGSQWCLKLTNCRDSTDQTFNTCDCAPDDINPQITIYFSSHTNSNVTCENFSSDNTDSASKTSISSYSLTNNTQNFDYKLDESNYDQFAKTKGLIKIRNVDSANSISSSNISDNSSSNESYKCNIKSLSGNETVIVIYARDLKEPTSVE